MANLLRGDNTQQTMASIRFLINEISEVLNELSTITPEVFTSRDRVESKLWDAKVELETAFGNAQRKGKSFYNSLKAAYFHLKEASQSF